MSYNIKSKIAEDKDLLRRIAACAAAEGVLEYATSWAARYLWQLAATPGWDTKYSDALDAGVELPGADEGVIDDDMICGAVCALIKRLAPDPVPDPGPVPDEEGEV